VTDWGSGTVSRIDAATNRRTEIRTGGQPTGIVAASGALWVGLGNEGTVVRIDPATRKVTDRIAVGAGAGWTAALGRDVWISNGIDNTAVHIDGTTRRVVASTPIGAVPQDGDAAGGAIWIPDQGGYLTRINPATGAVSGRYRSGARNPFVIAGSGTTLWVADYAGTDLLRIDLTRLG
jgi:YVTN family beta-propeller protein